MKTVFLTPIAALVLASCGPGTTIVTSSEAAIPKIQVSATGETSAAPDMATVTAGVVSEGKSAREAMLSNSSRMTTVFEELEKAGIERKYITTSQLSLQPRYDYTDRKAPRITGYEARNTVTAKSYDLDSVGPMLDALVEAGINSINGISFSIKDPKAGQAEAREEAIKEARAKAEAMAAAAGVTLGRLQSMSETRSGGFQPQPYAAAEMRMSAATPISAGEQSLSVTVHLVYEIEQ